MNPAPIPSSGSVFANAREEPLASPRPTPDPLPQVPAHTLGALESVAQRLVEGLRIGPHHNPAHGLHSQFSQHRPYVPGDEPRLIDWKAYARSDRYYSRVAEPETNAHATVFLDASQAMTYASGPLSKRDYAHRLATVLAYLLVRQGDSVATGVFDGETLHEVAPQNSPQVLPAISAALERTTARPRNGDAVAAAMDDLAKRATRRGFVIVISDLLDNSDAFLRGLAQLRFHGHDVVLFQTLDPCELKLPLGGRWRFDAMNGKSSIVAHSARIREAYLHELELFVHGIRKACHEAEVDHLLVNTGDPVERTITDYLLQRGNRTRRQ